MTRAVRGESGHIPCGVSAVCDVGVKGVDTETLREGIRALTG
ncbi:hypothetical protein [Actinoallomurus acanthiterrae]